MINSFNSVSEMLLILAVWRHVDKTGPEGHIDALLMYGQGKYVVKSVYCEIGLCFWLLNSSRLLDAVVVVGNGRLLRSWETTVGGLKWEAVLDTGRLYFVHVLL